jgi:CBS domain-containing protein
MSIRYAFIEIFTSEEARWKGTLLSKAIVEFIAHLGIAARCMVIRGHGGCYENGEISTGTIEVLSYTMPLKIEIVLPASELSLALPTIEDMVDDGIVMVEERETWIHKTQARLIPRHFKVRDVMTPNPQYVTEDERLRSVVEIMIQGGFNGVPVVDEEKRPLGMITQGDLISRGQLPIRLGLFVEFTKDRRDDYFNNQTQNTAKEIMSSPVITVSADCDLTQAVDLMLHHKLKRLPVVDDAGKLTGVLARLDVFRTVMSQTPDLQTFSKHHVIVRNIRTVREIMEHDMETVAPDTPIETLVKIVDLHAVHRVAVVDEEGKLVGLISDKDLFATFSSRKSSLWSLIMSKVPLIKSAQFYNEIVTTSNARTASDVMKTELITVTEETPLQEAIKKMVDHHLKRLPVINEQGLFLAMVSRDAVLRLGVHTEKPLPT